MAHNWFDDLYEDLFDDGRDDDRSTLVDDRLGGLDEIEENINLIPWWNAGFEDREAMAWLACGFTVQEARSALSAGISVDRAYDWLMIGYQETAAPEPEIIHPHPDQIPLEVSTSDSVNNIEISQGKPLSFSHVVGDELDTLFPTAPVPRRTRRSKRQVDADQLSLLDIDEPTPEPASSENYCEGPLGDQLSLFAHE